VRPELLANVHRRLGDCQRMTGNYAPAASDYDEALKLFTQIKPLSRDVADVR
jgi:hypothetical protein